MQPIISASLLAANAASLGNEANAVIKAGANWLHLDIMDNHYVPNLSFGPTVCQALREFGLSCTIDVHLMTKPVDNLITAFAKAGADYIVFHPEASQHLAKTIQIIIDNGCKPGLAFNPSTPLNYLDYTLEHLNLILLMSVNPGFGGQAFIPATLNKISQVKTLITGSGKDDLRLQVDGGINKHNIGATLKSGADTFVIGSHIFQSNNYQQTINELKAELNIC